MAWLEHDHKITGVDDDRPLDRLPGLLLVSEVAEYLSKCPRSVTRMIARAELPRIRFGATTYIPEAALVAQIDAQIMQRIDGKRRRRKASPGQIRDKK